MFQTIIQRINNRMSRSFTKTATYLAIILLAFSFNVFRLRAERTASMEQKEPELSEKARANLEAKPFFSLVNNRTYATTERARMWISYQGVSHIDFRVYRVNDPVKFFKQLDDPHQVGEPEETEIAESFRRSPSLLERIHSFKGWIHNTVKDYVRDQLKRDSRKSFNHKFRSSDQRTRTPLNIADYARVPLLNPSQLVSSWREKLTPMEDEYEQRMIPLGQRPAGVYLVEAVNGDLRAYSVAIVTDLTMVNKMSGNGEILIYAVNRKSGAPRAGVRVEVARGPQTLATGATDQSGILKTKIEKQQSAEAAQHPEDFDPEAEEEKPVNNAYLVMASDDENFAISDLDSFYFSEYTCEECPDENLTGYVYTDRPVYRPNQKVYFKGILRRWGQEGYEMIGGDKVNVTIEGPNREKISERELALSSHGTFSGEVEIADEAPLGSYHISVHINDKRTNTGMAYFQVEEYKKPEFKVKVTGPKDFAAAGEKVKFSVSARYFFGSPVVNADVKYYIYRSRYYHYWGGEQETDDGIDEDDGALSEGDYDDDGYYSSYGGDVVDEGEARLEGNGHLTVEFEVPEPDETDTWDYTYRLEAQVTDASRRMMQNSASFIGVRGRTIAEAHPERYIYYQNDAAKIRIRTGDYMGRPTAASVTLIFFEQHWEKVEKEGESEYSGKYTYTEYEPRERELASAVVETNAQGEATYDYIVPAPGYIYIKAIINDGGKQIVNRGGSFWASDRRNEWSDFGYQDYNEGTIKLIADKKSYQPGETAHVLAMLPTDKAHLLITTELTNVIDARQISATGRTVVIDVPIKASYQPNVFFNVTYVKDDEMYANEKMLIVPARDKMLRLEIIPNKQEYKPRQTASYTVLARNPDGSPAPGAEVSLGVVDEAIYSIQPETTESIQRFFYGRRYNQVQTNLSISYRFVGYSGDKPVNLTRNKPSYQLADFKNESEMAEPTIRKEFKDTAFWQPDVVTGADGKAVVKVKLPDNLTTWRATARAVTSDTRVGSTVQKVVSRKDVILRLEMPRFMTEGDTVTISGVVHNFLKADKQTRISIEVSGAQLVGPSTESVKIARQGEHRVDWRVHARQAGEVRLIARALTDTESDAVEMTLEIVPHGLRQTMGGVTTLAEENAEQSVSLDLPDHPDTQARSLRIEASPSVAGALFGALDYLTKFPYGCTEQTMSSFLPTVIVAQTLQEVKTTTIRDTNDIGAKVQRGLDRLYSHQYTDGGWGWWKNDVSDAFMTAYVVDGLTMASRAGYRVEDWRLARGRERLKEMIDAGTADAEVRAYMIYALNESGPMFSGYVDELFDNRGGLQPYGRALLALALKQRGDDRAQLVAGEIEASARVNDFDAHWESRLKSHYGNEQVMDVEATAFSLKALARIAPQSPLLPKAARWLVSNRGNGYYWASTKETAFAIFGLTDYLKVSRELTPDYTMEVYLNGEQVLARHVTEQDAMSAQTFVIQRKGRSVPNANQVRVVKRGRGVLYLSTTLEYFTGEEEVAARASSELKLTREYLRLRITENIDGKSSWKLEPLTGELRSGDLIVARLHVEGARAQYLMIEDPIPAGCEQITRMSGINLNYTEGQWSDWYSAREFRDQRTVFFLNRFDGKATFQYAMRVEIPGQFRVAPARAELMYQPTVQSNTTNAGLNIIDAK